MSKKDSIIVHVDGKKTNFYQEPKDRFTDYESLKLAKKEQAAAREDSSKEEILPYDRNYDSSFIQKKSKSKISRNPRLKSILLAITSAVGIGCVLGFLLISMFVNIGKDLRGTSNANPISPVSAVNNDETENNSNTSSTTPQTEVKKQLVPSLNAFIVQAGVFSEIENAQLAAEMVAEHGISSTVWKRDNQYILIAGVASTKEQAIKLVEPMIDDEMELYTKEWSTPTLELELTTEELRWIESFQTEWQKMVASVNAKDTLSVSNWETLLNDYPKDSVKIQSLIDNIQPYYDNMFETDHQEMSIFLLEIWKAYEQDILNI